MVAADWERLDPGASCLARTLPRNLQILDLSQNGLTDESAPGRIRRIRRIRIDEGVGHLKVGHLWRVTWLLLGNILQFCFLLLTWNSTFGGCRFRPCAWFRVKRAGVGIKPPTVFFSTDVYISTTSQVEKLESQKAHSVEKPGFFSHSKLKNVSTTFLWGFQKGRWADTPRAPRAEVMNLALKLGGRLQTLTLELNHITAKGAEGDPLARRPGVFSAPPPRSAPPHS